MGRFSPTRLEGCCGGSRVKRECAGTLSEPAFSMYISRIHSEEHPMAKGEQRSNKMAKKPKKDTSLPKDLSSSSADNQRPTPPVTSVLPKGKLKNK
jgi:hypothetical protein